MVDARPQFAIMRKNSILSSVTIQLGIKLSYRIDKVAPVYLTSVDK